MVRMTVLRCHTASTVATGKGNVEGVTPTAWRRLEGSLFRLSRQEIDRPEAEAQEERS